MNALEASQLFVQSRPDVSGRVDLDLSISVSCSVRSPDCAMIDGFVSGFLLVL
jgi:hypothetical protein